MVTRSSFIPVLRKIKLLRCQTGDPQQDPMKKIDPDKLFINEMRARIDSYFFIVLRNIKDTIPKIIGHFLVKSVQVT